jgi:thiol-disulfide isomerase/thioredoxin
MEDWLLGNPEADREAMKVAAAEGKTVTGFLDFVKWIETLKKDRGDRLIVRVMEKCHPTDHPKLEGWFLDYKEVQPGRWFPMTQGFAQYKGTHPKPITQYRSELKAVAVKVDTALPGALFAPPPPKDGAAVYDSTTDPPLSYKYKKDRTKAEWEALRARARKLQAEERKARARREELVGRPALPLPKAGWLNGKARFWADLTGKPVLLFFWAEWCARCRGYLSVLRQGDGALVQVIGVHTPGSNRADVEKALEEEKANAPVCIDTVEGKGTSSAGTLFTGYRLSGLPSAVLVDADGKVVALGDPVEVMQRLRKLLRRDRAKDGK